MIWFGFPNDSARVVNIQFATEGHGSTVSPVSSKFGIIGDAYPKHPKWDAN